MIKRIIKFIKTHEKIYISLVENDFHSRYNGSAFGVFWGVVQPLITVLVYWFVFQIGLRAGDRPDHTPYILWLICGMVPWFFFSEALGAVTNSLIEYGYLVKKLYFKVALIPMIKIGSSLIMHGIFVVLTTIILNFYGYKADWYYIQVLYYTAAATFLLVGLGLLLSSLTVFFRDMSQIVGIIIQIGFWMIPIVWGSEVLQKPFDIIFKLNPVFYIIEGYRECFLGKVFFWEHPILLGYFWTVAILVFVLGVRTFKKLEISFADVL